MRTTDPSRMSAAERLAEIGDILATGFVRYFANECKVIPGSENPADALDVFGDSEASCDSTTEVPT